MFIVEIQQTARNSKQTLNKLMKKEINKIENSLFFRINKETVKECGRCFFNDGLIITELEHIFNNCRAKMTSIKILEISEKKFYLPQNCFFLSEMKYNQKNKLGYSFHCRYVSSWMSQVSVFVLGSHLARAAL